MVRSWISKTWDVLRHEQNVLERFEHDLLKLEKVLKQWPERFGEPIDDLRYLRVTRCIGFTRMLIVNYGIVHDQKVVVINRLRLRKQK